MSYVHGRKAVRAERSSRDLSPLMIDVMHCLMSGAETSTRDISIKLNIQQSSIAHVIRDLIEESLAVKVARAPRYKLTNLGKIEINLIDNLKRSTEFVKHNENPLLNHNVDSLPVGFQVRIGMIDSQREPIVDVISSPHLKQEYLFKHLGECKEIRCILGIMTANHAKGFANAIKKGADVEIILSDRVRQTIRKNYSHVPKGILGLDNIRELLGFDNLKIYRIKEANISLWVTESTLFLALCRSDGSYDLENIIICKSKDCLEWGNMLFAHYRTKAQLVKSIAS